MLSLEQILSNVTIVLIVCFIFYFISSVIMKNLLDVNYCKSNSDAVKINNSKWYRDA